MLSQAPVSRRLCRTCRRLLAVVGELLILVGFVSGFGLAAQDPVQKEETKKTETKKDKPNKDEPKQEGPKKEHADKDEKKKTDADKELDELVKEMTRNMPNADPGTLQRVRQNVQNMPAEQRKNMLSLIKNRPPVAFPGQPPAVGVMPPGFGLPGNTARLGVLVDPPSAVLAEQLDLPKGQGLVVREVLADTAASKAGLKPNDLLLEFDGKAVTSRVDEFTRQIAALKPDTAVEMVVVRKGKKETIKGVKLPEAKALAPGFPQGGFGGPARPPGGFPQPPAAFQPPAAMPLPGFGAAAPVVTTFVRTQDQFTVRYQEGSAIITLTGQAADGKLKINQIHVQNGFKSDQYESVDKVAEQYRNKVKNLIEMNEKGSVKIESKSAP